VQRARYGWLASISVGALVAAGAAGVLAQTLPLPKGSGLRSSIDDNSGAASPAERDKKSRKGSAPAP
jgi:hypothetical protein